MTISKKVIVALDSNFFIRLSQRPLKYPIEEIIQNDLSIVLLDVVIQEMKSGYTMHDRLLRPTMVGVSKSPAKDKKG